MSSTGALHLHIATILEHFSSANFILRRCGGANFVVFWVGGDGSAVWPRYCFSSRSPLSQRVRLLPEPAGNLDRVNAGLLPPRALVACAVHFPMVPAAEGDREFVARFAAQRAWLHIAQMMGIGWLAAADEARLLHDIAKVLAAAIAPRGRNREHALVDALGPTPVGAFAGGNHLRPGNQRQRPFDRGCSRIG